MQFAHLHACCRQRRSAAPAEIRRAVTQLQLLPARCHLQVKARLANAVAEEAGMRQRLEGLLQHKVGVKGGGGERERHASWHVIRPAHHVPRFCVHHHASRHAYSSPTFHPSGPFAPAQAEAQAQLAEQLERRERAAQRAARLLKQLQAKGPAACKLPAGVSLEALAADVRLAQVRVVWLCSAAGWRHKFAAVHLGALPASTMHTLPGPSRR